MRRPPARAAPTGRRTLLLEVDETTRRTKDALGTLAVGIRLVATQEHFGGDLAKAGQEDDTGQRQARLSL
ncbi:hypothetical protein GCM10012286_23580 [Streptomyces lasiicapitis]|uniref:Uncharacterized protein n=1 Tax=Streptomyces lasiicapitis TaxID=1923961 RepID=A0ABQ2LRQ3_9ACTN|nr:hypothetical protein GCM10012286_23580 [Streptomyces lasiicapitis]